MTTPNDKQCEASLDDGYAEWPCQKCGATVPDNCDDLKRRHSGDVERPGAEAMRLAHEFLSDPVKRKQVQEGLLSIGYKGIAAMIDEAVVMATEIIRLADSAPSSTR